MRSTEILELTTPDNGGFLAQVSFKSYDDGSCLAILKVDGGSKFCGVMKKRVTTLPTNTVEAFLIFGLDITKDTVDNLDDCVIYTSGINLVDKFNANIELRRIRMVQAAR